MIFRLLTLLLLLPLGLRAQYELRSFNADYVFEEGVYLSHASWLANSPDLRWDDIEGEMVQLPEDYRVQIAGLRHKNGEPLESVFAVSLDGFPYLFTRHHQSAGFYEFAGLRFRGRYAYYRYNDTETKSKMMYAYNPLNGQPFRRGEVMTERKVTRDILLNVKSGERQPLSQQTVYALLVDHPDLQRAVEQLDPADQELRQKLVRAVKLYNEREPLMLQQLPR